MLSLYTSSTVLTAASRPSFVWSAKHGVRFVLPAVKPAFRAAASSSPITAPVPGPTKPAFNAFEARESRQSFFSHQISSTVRPSRPTSSISTSLRVLVVRPKVPTIIVEPATPSSAIVVVESTSTSTNSSPHLAHSAIEDVTLPSIDVQATIAAEEELIAPHSLETTPSTRQQNASPVLSSFRPRLPIRLRHPSHRCRTHPQLPHSSLRPAGTAQRGRSQASFLLLSLSPFSSLVSHVAFRRRIASL